MHRWRWVDRGWLSTRQARRSETPKRPLDVGMKADVGALEAIDLVGLAV